MRRNLVFLGSAFLILTLQAASQEKPATEDFKFTDGQSVYVIAVKSAAPGGRSTWGKLNRNLPTQPAHVQTRASSSDSDPLGRTTLEKPPTERATLERAEPVRRVLPPPEPELKQRIEQEFLKQKIFKIAESPEAADFIFFAHGEYIYFSSSNYERGFSSSARASMGDDKLDLNTLAKLGVAAVSASDYRLWQSDIPHLFEKAKWQEEVWGEFRNDRNKPFEEPSAQKLVLQFHKQVLKK